MIAAPRVLTAAGPGGRVPAVLEPGYVAIAGPIVTEVGQGPAPSGPDISLAGGTLVPGFVDLQVNGYFGVELSRADSAGWSRVTTRLPETGTTAFVPTVITAPLAEISATLRRMAGILPGIDHGARVLGIHLEGPFLSRARRGAHNGAWLTTPSPRIVADLLAAASGSLRLVTLAPECDGALPAIRQFAEAGVLVSVGHSDATARQVALAADAGARMVTHLFNAQRPLHHREPGVVGQALADPRLTSGLIADLRHVHPAACLVAFAAAPGRVCAVTDAVPCAGSPPGRYQFGGEPIELPAGDGVPPVRPDGTLAGSGLRMDSAVANLVSVGVGLPDAVAAATRVPADLIGRRDLGRLEPGAAADLTWLDERLRTRATWIGGHQVYPGPGDGCAV